MPPDASGASGFAWVAWVVLGVLILEVAALFTWRRALLGSLWPTIGSGGAIVLALAAALSGSGLAVVGLLLALGGGLHAFDLLRQLRAGRDAGN